MVIQPFVPVPQDPSSPLSPSSLALFSVLGAVDASLSPGLPEAKAAVQTMGVLLFLLLAMEPADTGLSTSSITVASWVVLTRLAPTSKAEKFVQERRAAGISAAFSNTLEPFWQGGSAELSVGLALGSSMKAMPSAATEAKKLSSFRSGLSLLVAKASKVSSHSEGSGGTAGSVSAGGSSPGAGGLVSGTGTPTLWAGDSLWGSVCLGEPEGLQSSEE